MPAERSHFEVEQKYRVADLGPVLEWLSAAGVQVSAPARQVDRYYRHPQRDFAHTDEAFRLRSVGPHNCITYKGPKIDAETKTRYEEEVSLADGDEARLAGDAIFQHLGFTPVATVAKLRCTAKLLRDGQEFELALDRVDGLGQFVEIEIGVSATGPEDPVLDDARSRLARLVDELELTEVERRSYLELLLEE